jgi:tetratricopeptide (TPR) repeat protein
LATEKSKVKKNDYQKALKAYSQAMKVFRREDFKRASELLQAFIKKYPAEKELVDRSQIYLSICEKRQKKERVELKTFDDYYQHSVYTVNQGDYEEALKFLDKARQMKPKEGKILYLMADAYCLMGKKEKCLEHLKKAIQIDKDFSTLAQNESDFEELREDKKFKLITRMT